MAQWTLADIRKKARQVSGRLSLSELSNNQLDDIINQFVQFEFPAEVKLDRNYSFYEFNTTVNTQSYTLPETYTNFDPEAKIDNKTLKFYSDPDKFDAENHQNISRKVIGTGDDSTTAFSDTLGNGNFPIESGSVIVDDTVEVFTDNSDGTLTGDQGGSGTINYTTGAVSVTFNTAPTDGTNIEASWKAFQPGQPVSVLQFNNQFTFYPVPDRTYRFKIKAWSINTVQYSSGNVSSSFTSATDRPLKDQWGPAIAYGSARRIHADFGELDAYKQVTALYKEQIAYILRRTHQDLLDVRAMPKF